MIIKLPLSQLTIKYNYFTFKEFKQFLYIIYDNDTSYQIKYELLSDYIFNNFVLNNDIVNKDNLDTYDIMYFMYNFFIKSFDSSIDIKFPCANDKCQVERQLIIAPAVINENVISDIISVNHKNESYRIGLVSQIEPMMCLGDDKYNELNESLTIKEYKELNGKIFDSIVKLNKEPIVKYEIDYICTFCGTENKHDIKYSNYMWDLIEYIKHNYSLKYYYNMILIMKRFGYSILELNDMYLSEIEYIENYEKKLLDDKKNNK